MHTNYNTKLALFLEFQPKRRTFALIFHEND